MKDFIPSAYHLRSVLTGKEFEDTGWLLDAPGEEKPSLIRTIYDERQLSLKGDDYGFYKFAGWLPLKRVLKGSSAPVTYKSEGLARHLGLDNLWITFSGYWPEKGCIHEDLLLQGDGSLFGLRQAGRKK